MKTILAALSTAILLPTTTGCSTEGSSSDTASSSKPSQLLGCQYLYYSKAEEYNREVIKLNKKEGKPDSLYAHLLVPTVGAPNPKNIFVQNFRAANPKCEAFINRYPEEFKDSKIFAAVKSEPATTSNGGSSTSDKDPFGLSGQQE